MNLLHQARDRTQKVINVLENIGDTELRPSNNQGGDDNNPPDVDDKGPETIACKTHVFVGWSAKWGALTL